MLQPANRNFFLFNDALNIFFIYGYIYGIGRMVKDHSDSERRNTAATTWATLSD